MTKPIYLDYAAATPLDRHVLEAMLPYFTDDFYNPSATYLAGRDARKTLDQARGKIAQTIGGRPGEVVFTAGATEANNLALYGIAAQYPKSEILVSSIEHESVLAPAEELKAKHIPVDKKGAVDLAILAKQISSKTVLVSVMLVNNELGAIQPLREIAELIKAERAKRLKNGNDLPIYLHSDAAQAGNWLDLHVARLGVDLMSINGGKIYGPKQSGILYLKAGVKLKPLIRGGGQEFGLRSGTENVAACMGLAKALELAQASARANAKKISRLREDFIAQIQVSMPNAKINGPSKLIAPHIINLTIPSVDNERLMMQLDEAGVQVAVGSACSASSMEPSHVLKAIGLSDQDARSTIRISLGKDTSLTDLSKLANNLNRICSE